jgi:hypothetical protein
MLAAKFSCYDISIYWQTNNNNNKSNNLKRKKGSLIAYGDDNDGSTFC